MGRKSITKTEVVHWEQGGLEWQRFEPNPLSVATAQAWKAFHENAQHLTTAEREAFLHSAKLWEMETSMIGYVEKPGGEA